MSNVDGSGALQQLGIVYLPLGTPDELRKEGIDPRENACCAPTQQGIVRGCAMWDKCRFNLARRGGFKGKPGGDGGMRYIGYRLVTTDGQAKEDFMSCYAYTATMQDREDHATMLRLKGQKSELISIIAQQGEKIVRRVRVPKNENDKSLTADYKYVTEEVTVPAYPRCDNMEQLNYEQQLAKKERERLQQEENIAAEVYEQAKANMEATDVEDWGAGVPIDPEPSATPTPEAKPAGGGK